MPSAPRLVGRPSVPRALAMPIWGASRQLSTRLPTPTARLRPRCRRIPISPRARPPIAQNSSFGERFCHPCSPDVRAKGLRFRRFPRHQDLRPPLLSPISLHPSKTVHQTKNFAEKANVRPNRHRPTLSLLHAASSRKATAFRARRAQNGRAIRMQRREAEVRLDKRRRATKRPFAAEPLSAPRLRPRPPSNDPPDFWRRDGQKGRSRALGQRFARMPP